MLFLSQLNDTINSPSTESSHSTPTLRVHGTTTRQVVLPREDASASTRTAPEKSKQPTPSLDLSQSLPEHSSHTSAMPTVTAGERKQTPTRRSQKRVQSPPEVLEDEGYYANVVKRLRSGSMSTNWIRRNLCTLTVDKKP